MAFSRYKYRNKIFNDETLYSEHFKTRDVEQINHYSTPEYVKDKTYSLKELNVKYHTWGYGDRLYKLAQVYYGDPSLWWVIAQFNQKPTESHIKEGDTILIPIELEKTLSYLGI